MINTEIIHPEILKVLASAGHGAQIVIVDGHYPFSTGARPEVPRVYLNYAPGLLSVPDILRPMVKTIPLEAVAAPVPDDGSEPPIFPEYREILPKSLEIKKLQRFDFYDHVQSPNTALLIASAEKRTYACISLTIGLRSF